MGNIYSQEGTGDHDLRITPAGEASMTCRTTWRVECARCRTVVHPATTAPWHRVEEHIKHGPSGDFGPIEED